MTAGDPALDPFGALIGTWASEATHPEVDAVVRGTIAFQWLEGSHLLVQRSRSDDGLFPGSIPVIGAPETATGWSWITSTHAACAVAMTRRSRPA